MTPDPRRSERQIELSERAGRFLTEAYKRKKYRRAEAAEAAGVSVGYLQSALAGRFVTPKPDVLRRMADAWGFNPIEYFLAVGTLTEDDVKDWTEKNPPPLPDYLQGIASRLDAVPPDRRDKALSAILNLLDVLLSV